MKIIAIGRNYVEHIEELKNEKPSEPVVFLKPDTALLKDNAPFYYPDFSQDVHHEVEILVKISKEGKYIEEKFAHKYYDEIGVGIDFTARDIQQKCKEKGLPWEIAKAFNGSAPVSEFVPKTNFANIRDINFSLQINGETRQQGNTGLTLFNFDYIISYVSKFFTLKKGDIIFTGTPKGVGPVKIGDKLTAFIEGEKMLEFEVK
ncbi:fumarylacetoacetate hydrolase family protein [Cytophagaceae bacterium DM2B3-1]|uniref:Fumarylacetoacetate hydrolase family protein n=2 Tax=Xanthocytophaga TaxID=3078918 RepID=A0ABT7CJ66_9BACT|nr:MULTISPECIES: fumarylacetoacetate hydrolase family protein [Xanthocytophaga]MDJ1467691.1 fumarylacetoacetate hydrolase family protein [Xanthocytophaga flavus]MDJ1493771.1 fumarylacetoacetate hydrolase family protein [Xanthocytophaga flavus]MDJ1501317.1 fumarylacetoacetate hydrolase family protein [Xanthocytophaga agilis]